jgi:hypothetical protein
MHRKRKQRKRPMDPPKCPPRTHQDRTIDRVEAAACELYALDSGPESDRAFESKRAQFRRFIRSLMSPSRPRVSA